LALSLSRAAVGIKIEWTEGTPAKDEKTGEDILKYSSQGSAWFRTKKEIVTIEHVARSLELSTDTWTPITLFWGSKKGEDPTHEFEMNARLKSPLELTDTWEDSVTIELEHAVPGAIVRTPRYTPLVPKEPIVSAAYTKGKLSLATGSFSPLEPDPNAEPSEEEPPPYLALELADWKNTNRYVIGHGASGAPVFDCDGNVVATLVDTMFQNSETSEALEGMKNALEMLQQSGIDVSKELAQVDHISTAWGTANVYGVAPTPFD
jgi:hypothetical protein